MRKREPVRRSNGTALAFVAAGGALLLALAGCGQSGPLYLPEESPPAAAAPAPAAAPAAEPGTSAGRHGASAVRLALT